MTDTEISYDDFLNEVHPMNMEFVTCLNDYLIDNGCRTEIKPAARSSVLSCVHKAGKKTVFNYVFRKSGMIARIYADNQHKYPELVRELPGSIKKIIADSPDCKRLLDPAACSSRCPKGYTFTLGGETHKKCRYNCFMIPVNPETSPHIRELVCKELEFRNAK